MDQKPKTSTDPSRDNDTQSRRNNVNQSEQTAQTSPSSNLQDGQTQELSFAEKKKQAKAGKAARRAAQKAEGSNTTDGQAMRTNNAAPVHDANKSKKEQHQAKLKQTPDGGDAAQQKNLPSRPRRQSGSGASSQKPGTSSAQHKPTTPAKSRRKEKQHPSLTHLYSGRRRPQPSQLIHPAAHRDVHPAVQVLALHLESYRLCGSQARTVALLLTLKTVIRGYDTPPGTSLPRHMSSTFLSPQLQHVKAYGRPFCTAQSNAVRWLKNKIATLDPSLPEPTAINMVVAAIDDFVRERFTIADRVIAQNVAGTSDESEDSIIEDGDNVLLFGKSALVCASLREAVKAGKRFSVVCVDAGRPLWEGKTMAKSLISLKAPREEFIASTGDEGRSELQNERQRSGIIDISYVPISQLHAHLLHNNVTKALLGSNTIYSNGSILSRAGQAQAALAVRTECPDATIYVLAESIKCAERAVLGTGSLAVAELGPEHDLVPASTNHDKKEGDEDVMQRGRNASEPRQIGETLNGWEEKDNLYVVNLLHDVTPPELVDAIVTEVGRVPSHSSAAVGRLIGLGGEMGDV